MFDLSGNIALITGAAAASVPRSPVPSRARCDGGAAGTRAERLANLASLASAHVVTATCRAVKRRQG